MVLKAFNETLCCQFSQDITFVLLPTELASCRDSNWSIMVTVLFETGRVHFPAHHSELWYKISQPSSQWHKERKKESA